MKRVLTYAYVFLLPYLPIYKVSSEDIPISRRRGLAARTKTDFCIFTYKLNNNIIKNHEMNEKNVETSTFSEN